MNTQELQKKKADLLAALKDTEAQEAEAARISLLASFDPIIGKAFWLPYMKKEEYIGITLTAYSGPKYIPPQKYQNGSVREPAVELLVKTISSYVHSA